MAQCLIKLDCIAAHWPSHSNGPTICTYSSRSSYIWQFIFSDSTRVVSWRKRKPGCKGALGNCLETLCIRKCIWVALIDSIYEYPCCSSWENKSLSSTNSYIKVHCGWLGHRWPLNSCCHSECIVSLNSKIGRCWIIYFVQSNQILLVGHVTGES